MDAAGFLLEHQDSIRQRRRLAVSLPGHHSLDRVDGPGRLTGTVDELVAGVGIEDRDHPDAQRVGVHSGAVLTR